MEPHRPFTFYLPDRDKERLRRLAFERDLSISDVVRAAIAEFFDRSKEGGVPGSEKEQRVE